MTSNDPRKWLLLIHQIPPKPNALRVKIWRRLQQVGAAAVKQSVYAMPLSEQSREDLSWILKEIIAGGGEGSIAETRFREGLTDEQVIALFQSARKADYEKIIQEAHQLLSEWGSGQSDPLDPAVKSPVQVSKLQRRLEEVTAIDFFQAPERGTAEILLKDLTSRVSGESVTAAAPRARFDNLKGKKWVTRRNLFVDRIACGWLIRRFVDREAGFKFVGGPHYTPAPGELRFDMFEGEFTHEGDCCTFEVMIRRLAFQDRALVPMAEMVHDIDLKDAKYGRGETAGFNALLTGLVGAHPDDDQRMEEGIRLFENLYAYFQRRKGP
ncbi:MAG: chromate resistance protein [Desulfobacterales bacterium]|nr:MAG: chromate resistance protein [Desulfobacterales bacterium]